MRAALIAQARATKSTSTRITCLRTCSSAATRPRGSIPSLGRRVRVWVARLTLAGLHQGGRRRAHARPRPSPLSRSFNRIRRRSSLHPPPRVARARHVGLDASARLPIRDHDAARLRAPRPRRSRPSSAHQHVPRPGGEGGPADWIAARRCRGTSPPLRRVALAVDPATRSVRPRDGASAGSDRVNAREVLTRPFWLAHSSTVLSRVVAAVPGRSRCWEARGVASARRSRQRVFALILTV